MTHRCHIAATLVTQDDTVFSLLHPPMQCEFMEDVRLSEFRKVNQLPALPTNVVYSVTVAKFSELSTASAAYHFPGQNPCADVRRIPSTPISG